MKDFCGALSGTCGKALKHSCATALKDNFGRHSSETLLLTIYVRNPCRRLSRHTKCNALLQETVLAHRCKTLCATHKHSSGKLPYHTNKDTLVRKMPQIISASVAQNDIPRHRNLTKYCASLVFLITGPISKVSRRNWQPDVVPCLTDSCQSGSRDSRNRFEQLILGPKSYNSPICS